MRLKDEEKLRRIKQACIDLTFEVGVEGISASKLAKIAKVSSSSIYTYFENMRDMLQTVNQEAVTTFFQEIVKPLSPNLSIQENYFLLWEAVYTYCVSNYKEFMLMMRMASSCVIDTTSALEVKPYHQDIQQFLDKAIAENVIKEIKADCFIYIAFYPMYGILKANIEAGVLSLNNELKILLQTTSWDAIRK